MGDLQVHPKKIEDFSKSSTYSRRIIAAKYDDQTTVTGEERKKRQDTGGQIADA